MRAVFSGLSQYFLVKILLQTAVILFYVSLFIRYIVLSFFVLNRRSWESFWCFTSESLRNDGGPFGEKIYGANGIYNDNDMTEHKPISTYNKTCFNACIVGGIQIQ